MDRRDFIKTVVATAGGTLGAGCDKPASSTPPPPAPVTPAPLEPTATAPTPEPPAVDPILATEPLRFPWQTEDPFLFCAYHDDAYPTADARMAPATSLAGRKMGSDFSRKDGWSMYHGRTVPGFPRHPHRGFETVTVVRRGLVDHSDSLGATARYGGGDTQWMTAGRGIVHAEMFPLLDQEADNPLELFQIWLNLPAADKMAPPYFTMMWQHTIPEHRFTDPAGRATTVVTIAGALEGKQPPSPPPESWASDPSSKVAIWTISLAPGATWTLPAAEVGLSRALYFHRGSELRVGARSLAPEQRIRARADQPVPLTAGPDGADLLLLQGRPLNEPVAHHGPFVMNNRQELRQAFQDYQRTGFGGWPWPDDAPVHPRDQGRFAIHADGRKDVPT